MSNTRQFFFQRPNQALGRLLHPTDVVRIMRFAQFGIKVIVCIAFTCLFHTLSKKGCCATVARAYKRARVFT